MYICLMNTNNTIQTNPVTENVGDVLDVSGWSKTKEEITQFGDDELTKEFEDVYLYGLFFEDDLYYDEDDL